MSDASVDAPGDPESVARIICLRMLEARPRTRNELAKALLKKGVPPEAGERVLDRLTEVGLIDDAALAESFAMARHTERGLARRAIATQLARRGVDDLLVTQATAQIAPEDELAAACRLAVSRLRRMPLLDSVTQQRRLVGLLMRRGYSAEMTYSAVRSALAELGAGDAVADPELG